MKILFLSWSGGVDYMSDTLLAGLVSLGHDVVDVPYQRHLSAPTKPGDPSLYGLGFSFAGVLPDRSGIDRTRITERIRAHEFDFVVYGAVRRDQGFLDDVRSAYRRSEIAFVDGSDVVGGNPADKFGVEGLERTGVLFRREIETPWSPARPVHFGIPACKALAKVPHKVRVAAQYRPKTSDAFARRSYAFKDEQSYYRMYADARFAVTCRRAGWDCLRHYEILANRCVPVFDVDDMPAWTLVDWPRGLQREANELYERYCRGERPDDEWADLERRFNQVFTQTMTAERVAERLVGTMLEGRSRPVDWETAFDRVFCIHSTAQDFKSPFLYRELARVGLLGSPVFEMRTTTPAPWDKTVGGLGRPPVTDPKVANLGAEVHRIMRESLLRGYRRILVVENDMAFLKDTAEIQRIVDRLPDKDCVQLDHFFPFNDPWKHTCAHSKLNYPIGDGTYFDPGGAIFYSGTAIAYNRAAMARLADFMAKRPTAPDGELQHIGSRGLSRTSIALQTVYSGCITSNVTSHHRGYKLAGHDYGKYNFPAGYGEWSYIDSNTGEVMKPIQAKDEDWPVPAEAPQPAEGHLKICVYAIARNEGKFVDRWMDSMSEADGVYVLDTGSTDGTVDRLRARGAHVETKTYDPWRFDVPRNDSMALCPADTDVYVCTDLDEVLNKGWRRRLEDAWLGYEKTHGARPTRARYDYIWGWAPDGKTPAVKFRYDKFHDSNYKWVYPVHEVLERRDESRPDRWLDTSGILLEHHPDPAKSRGSYLGLLELAVKERPREARMAFYLAREYSFYRKWDDMIEWCRKYVDMPGGWNVERAAAMELLGKAYWTERGDRDLAELWFRRACDEAPDQREAACTWADLLLAEGKTDMAVDILLKTLERTRGKPPPDNHITRRELWDASFYDKLGLALWRAGRRDEARVTYRIAVLKYPDNEFLKRQLAACGESGPDRLARLLAASYPGTKKGGSNGMEQKDAHA